MTEEKWAEPQISSAPIQDEVVGTISWNAKFRWWSFSVKSSSGARILAYVFPSNEDEPFSGFRISTIRTCANWVCTNELKAKNLIIDRMFTWWFRQNWSEDSANDGVVDEDGIMVDGIDERDEKTERERFASNIYLGCLHFKEDKCVMCYETGNLMNAHSFFVIIGPDCELPAELMWG